MKTLMRLWADQSGAVVSAELVLIITILILGMVVGLTSLRDQVTQELGDVAGAISTINQSFSFSGATGHHSSTAGSIFVDFTDSCDTPPDAAGEPPVCISVCSTPATTESAGS